MALTIGQVIKSEQLPARDNGKGEQRGALWSVSVDGFSMLYNPEKNDGRPAPQSGTLIRAHWNTYWPREGGRPRFWLVKYSEVGE